MHKTNLMDVSRTELSPLSFLRRSMQVMPGRLAVIHGERRYTYMQFSERIYRLASGLAAAGLSPQEKVAFLCPNIPAMLEAHFAVPLAGGVLVTINTRLNPSEVNYILRHSESKFLFADRELFSQLESIDLQGITVVEVADTGLPDDPYERFLAQGSPEPVFRLPDSENDPIALNYTSGTTGKPKGVIFTHRGAYLNALGEIIETGMGFDTVYLWTLPLFHCNGWCFSWAVTAVAGTHVCLRKPDPADIWEAIYQRGVTHFNGAPTVQTLLVNHPAARPLGRPITVTIAGAPPPPTLIDRVKALNFRPIHVYGLTETYGPHTVCEWNRENDVLPADEQAALRARQGQSYLTADPVRVVDENLHDVPKDGRTIGEVVMRGNNIMKEYFKDPEATEAAFKGGWFHSGDLAVWHADNNIELRDRLKDIIISGGENISTIEIEQALVRHPAVLECAVVAIPDEKWGERPKAFVTLKKDAYASESELIAFCKTQIAHFKCPAAIEFGNLPKTSTGKVQKYLLREKEWGKRDKRIH
jgi:fatty-acyl-CoA synthase